MFEEKLKELQNQYRDVTQEINRLQIIATKLQGAYEVLSEMEKEVET